MYICLVWIQDFMGLLWEELHISIVVEAAFVVVDPQVLSEMQKGLPENSSP